MNVLMKVKNAGFSYLDGHEVFGNVNFTIEEGQIFSIIGPNGAGKSTLLNCITNLLQLNTGEIFIDGKLIKELDRKTIAKNIGYVPQTHNATYGYSVRDFVVMGRAPHISIYRMPSNEDFVKTDAAIESMGIAHLADRPYTDISGGERQQAMIARAIVQEPKIIIMDEPTSALDFGNQLKTIRMIKDLSKRGFAIIMTTHNPDHAIMLEDTVGILDRSGHLTVGPSKDTITEEMLSLVYKTDVKIEHVEKVGRNVCIAKL
jgi:iron complex transport system ATP-binding protein